MEYSGLLPAPTCGNTSRSLGKIILVLVILATVSAIGYYVYKQFLAPKPKKDENLEIIVTNPGAHVPGNTDYAGRLMLQPLPYRCPYNN